MTGKWGTFDGWARLLLTVALLGILVWWLVETRSRMDAEPVVKNGVVTVDPFKNAQTILLLVVPLATTAIGYWFGAQGKEKAEEKAAATSAQLNAVVDSSEEPLLEKAMKKNPRAFGITGQQSLRKE